MLRGHIGEEEEKFAPNELSAEEGSPGEKIGS
jgi:hypothetical protein